MFSSGCTEFVIGPPVIAIDALLELRDLLTVLRASPQCDKPSLRPLPKEGKNEGSVEAKSSATQSSTTGPDPGRTPRQQGRGTRARAGRTPARRNQPSKSHRNQRKRRSR